MAEDLIPTIIPGMVSVSYVGKDDDQKKNPANQNKVVFPIDAKELVATGDWKVNNDGAVQAARLNVNPLSGQPIDLATVKTEVTGIAGQVHLDTGDNSGTHVQDTAGSTEKATDKAADAPAKAETKTETKTDTKK